ncbi:MAG: hypothetical protein EXR66_01295 [Dehalococcoidia bacterium]|nr:hypothetical protein [Dehalococcoidia bacterium]
MVGGLFAAGAAGAAIRIAFMGGSPDLGRLAAIAIGGAAGLALIRWPVGGTILSTAVPAFGAPLIAFGMAHSEPDKALIAMPYFVWLVAIAGFFQRPAAAVASTVWCMACFLA